jgi:hypothetical protein
MTKLFQAYNFWMKIPKEKCIAIEEIWKLVDTSRFMYSFIIMYLFIIYKYLGPGWTSYKICPGPPELKYIKTTLLLLT